MPIPAGQTYSHKAAQEFADRGRRASDVLNLVRIFHDWTEIKTKWMAFSLADGHSDGTIYDTRLDAINHQLHETQCAYVCFVNLMGGADPRDMAIYLKFQADAYRAGMRLIDPDTQNGGPELLMRTSDTDYMRKVSPR